MDHVHTSLNKQPTTKYKVWLSTKASNYTAYYRKEINEWQSERKFMKNNLRKMHNFTDYLIHCGQDTKYLNKLSF